MEEIKRLIYIAFAMIAGFIDPVRYSVKVLLFVGVANFICGLLAGLIKQQERFAFRKALNCLIEAAIYVVIVSSTFTVGHYMEDREEAESVVKGITYIMTYFYAENILRNLKILFPDNRVFAFLHYLIALEFIKRIPAYGEFLKRETKSKKQKNESNSR